MGLESPTPSSQDTAQASSRDSPALYAAEEREQRERDRETRDPRDQRDRDRDRDRDRATPNPNPPSVPAPDRMGGGRVGKHSRHANASSAAPNEAAPSVHSSAAHGAVEPKGEPKAVAPYAEDKGSVLDKVSLASNPGKRSTQQLQDPQAGRRAQKKEKKREKGSHRDTRDTAHRERERNDRAERQGAGDDAEADEMRKFEALGVAAGADRGDRLAEGLAMPVRRAGAGAGDEAADSRAGDATTSSSNREAAEGLQGLQGMGGLPAHGAQGATGGGGGGGGGGLPLYRQKGQGHQGGHHAAPRPLEEKEKERQQDENTATSKRSRAR
jgi:hypothetical protein